MVVCTASWASAYQGARVALREAAVETLNTAAQQPSVCSPRFTHVSLSLGSLRFGTRLICIATCRAAKRQADSQCDAPGTPVTTFAYTERSPCFYIGLLFDVNETAACAIAHHLMTAALRITTWQWQREEWSIAAGTRRMAYVQVCNKLELWLPQRRTRCIPSQSPLPLVAIF